MTSTPGSQTPSATRMSSPGSAASTASWIVAKAPGTSSVAAVAVRVLRVRVRARAAHPSGRAAVTDLLMRFMAKLLEWVLLSTGHGRSAAS